MRIVIATGIFPPDIGGPATYTEAIFYGFKKLGHTVHVVTYADKHNEDTQSIKEQYGKNLHQIYRSLPKGFRHILYFFSIIRFGWRADIIYAQDTVSAGLPAVCASLLLRKKFAVKIVGDYAWEQGMQRFGVTDLLDEFLQKKYGWQVEFLRSVERWVADHARTIIVPSVYLAGVVRTWGVKKGSITVIYNAVHTPKVPEKLQAVARKTADSVLRTSDPVLLSVGRLVPWKGQKMLIGIMPELLKKYSNAKLVLVGGGPERQRLETYASDCGVSHGVSFTGDIARYAVQYYISKADIFLLNTGYEGFSHQLLEVLATTIPVITTDVGGNKEIIQGNDGAHILVAEYNNKDMWIKQIMRVLEHKTFSTPLFQNKRQVKDIYNEDSTIIKTLGILSSK